MRAILKLEIFIYSHRSDFLRVDRGRGTNKSSSWVHNFINIQKILLFFHIFQFREFFPHNQQNNSQNVAIISLWKLAVFKNLE